MKNVKPERFKQRIVKYAILQRINSHSFVTKKLPSIKNQGETNHITIFINPNITLDLEL